MSTIVEKIETLLEGVDIEKDNKEKLTSVIEAAVSSILTEEKSLIEEEMTTKMESMVEARLVDIQEQVDKYMDYVVENWLEDNQLAIESSIKVELAESFLSGFKNLMIEHNIEAPEGQLDLVESQNQRIRELEESLNGFQVEYMELSESMVNFVRDQLIKESSEGLAETQKVKFRNLVEEIEFVDEDSYQNKLKTIKESFFNGKKDESEEETDEEENEDSCSGKKKPMDKKMKKMDDEDKMNESRLLRIRNPYKS